MIEVELPDKSVAEFPDGTPHLIMKNAIRKLEERKRKKEEIFPGASILQELAEKPETEVPAKIRAIPPTLKELATTQIPFAKYLTGAGREELKGEFFPIGTTTEPEKLKEIEKELVTGEEKISPYESLARETMTGLEWMGFPTAMRYGGAVAKEILPKRVTSFLTKERHLIQPKAPPKLIVSGMEKKPAIETEIGVEKPVIKSEIPPTAQHLELMPEEYPGVRVAVKSEGTIYEAKLGEATHPEIVINNKLDPERSIPGFTREGKFIEQYPEAKVEMPKPVSENLYKKATIEGIKVYRGEATRRIGEEYASDPGDFGRGIYYSVSKARARAYGGKERVTETTVKFENPLILSEENAYNLSDKYGTITGERPIGSGIGSKEFRLENAQKMTEDLLSKGYDGLISVRKGGDLEIVDFRPYRIKPEAKVEAPIFPEVKPEISPETLEAQVKGGEIKPLPKYAGTEEGIQASAINLERLNTPDDVKHFLDGFTKTIEEKIGRRKYTWEEIEDIGTELGWDLKKAKSQLGKLTGGELSGRIDAMRQLNATVTTDFYNKLMQLPVDPAQRTPAMKMQLREDLRRLTNSVSITSEIASEMGRGLGMHRKEVGYNKLYNKIIGTIDDIYGTKELPDDLINKLQALDPNKASDLANFLIKLSKTKTIDHINRIWYDIILSNPPTHGANFTGNTLRFSWKYPEKTTTAGIEVFRSMITGKPRERFFGEVPADFFSLTSGIKDGVRAGLKTLKTGISPEMGTKLDVPRMAQAQAPWRVVEAIRPTTMLGVADDMAKGVIYRTEMAGLAYRKATMEGLKGRAKDLRIQEILNEPPEELANKAWKLAEEGTFQQKLGEIGNYVMRIRDVEIPGTNVRPFIFLVPFIKTGTNIAKFTAQTTPMNIPWVGFKAAKGMISGPEISEQLARPFLGTMVAMATYLMAKEGYLTGGGPKNRTERDEKLRTGWQPYSWNIDNKYYGFARAEPIGSLWGMVADFADNESQMTDDEKTKYFENIVRSASKNVTSKTWWQGATRALDAVSDPEHYGKGFVEGLAGAAIPSVSGGVARAIDPYFREPQDIVDVLKMKIPKLSEQVPVKINRWGEPIERPGSGFMRFISPIQVSEAKGTPIDRELEGLKLNLGIPSKKIRDVELTPQEWRQMVAEAGQKSKAKLNQLVTSSRYQNLDLNQKAKEITRIDRHYRNDARERMERKLKKEGRLK